MNPLEISKVLEQVLDYLSVSDLKTIRFVGLSWNYEACTLLRKKEHVLLINLNNMANFTKCFKKQFCTYDSFVFGSKLLMPQIEYNAINEILASFCQHFKNSVTKIHLNLCYENNSRLNEILKEIFKGLPQLKSISLLLKDGVFPEIFSDNDENINFSNIRKLYINCAGYGSTKHDIEPYISCILRKCHNLETISCKTVITKVSSENQVTEKGNFIDGDIRFLVSNRLLKISDAILRSILSLSKSPQFGKGVRHISNLEVLLKLNQRNLKALSEIPFELESCYLELDEWIEQTTLNKFLCRFKNTLQHLYLEFSAKSAIKLEFLNPMLSLKTIQLVNYKRSMSFIISCPCLYTISIKNAENIKCVMISDLFQNSTCHSSLRTFKLSSKLSIQDQCLTKVLVQTFLNLTKLCLENVDNDTMLRNVFKDLKSLTDLTLSGKDISDGGICGESDNILKLLFESMITNNESAVLSSHCWELKPRFPCISDLNNLQFCKIEANLITDAGLAFGISKCKRLKSLYVFSRLELVTNFGLQTLQQLEDLSYLKINIRNLGWVSLNKMRANNTNF